MGALRGWFKWIMMNQCKSMERRYFFLRLFQSKSQWMSLPIISENKKIRNKCSRWVPWKRERIWCLNQKGKKKMKNWLKLKNKTDNYKSRLRNWKNKSSNIKEQKLFIWDKFKSYKSRLKALMHKLITWWKR